nr:LysR substrate-binding domain-containing protein [Nonomuraea sp. FMUSA5-5]
MSRTLARLRRTLQAADLAGTALAPGLLRLAGQEAPGVSFRLLAEEGEASPALRDGRIDLEVGSIDHVDPETQVEELVTLGMTAAVRPGHPLAGRPLDAARLAAAEHVVVSRRDRFTGPSTPPWPSGTSTAASPPSCPATWRRWRRRPAATSSASCPPRPPASPSHLSPTPPPTSGCASSTSPCRCRP